MSGQKYVHIAWLHPHPANIREDLGDLTGMAASVAVHGVLQPIVVERHPSIPNAYQVLPVREPGNFTGRHRLARKARALCDARDHAECCRVGMVACGQCWETTIRGDEKLSVATLRTVS